ncbi:metallopeptidase family protein [Paracoccus contaminans]|uniref:Neutral zinc metallopeptidase n=1 Tax=Paracoccus contaminans TaxID=1945662 RepID=A0A1W6CVI7_9RHOB|nr:metallopeptidase family protein [Paracoccus contaminans]ARJ68809.1 neutral zinc metallopeptidase [Paracoccus contaminans]
MTDWTERAAPAAADIEALARAVLAELPGEFAARAADVILRIEDVAGEDVLDELEIDDPFDLTGLYDGIPLTEKSVADPQHLPDTVRLYRRAILDEWAERGDVTLGALVRNVVIHEFAHHFGWSDADIARIDAWWT